MNRKQWLVLGLGLVAIGALMFYYANLNCSVFSLVEGLMTCRYSYSRPAIILGLLGILFSICAGLEPEKKG